MSFTKFISLSFICVCFLFVLAACKTTPEEQPETPQAPEKQEPEASVEQPAAEKPPAKPEEEPVSLDAEIEAARAALRRANLMGANKYFPREYRALADSLNNAASEKDYSSASSMLRGVVMEANKLHDRTLTARRKEYEESFYASDKALKGIKAGLFAPKEYDAIIDKALTAVRAYEADNLAEAERQARETLVSQATLYTNLDENIRYVNILIRDSENYIADAEENEAFIYASEELQEANKAYSSGRMAFENYNIEESAKLLAKAKQNAIMAARVSTVRKKQVETDALLISTQQKIESASRLKVLDNEGNISSSRPWDGADYLRSNPLIDHSELIEDVEFETPELRNLNDQIEPVDERQSGIPVDIPINEGEVLVNADEQGADYLLFAEEMWQKGVKARNNGQFDLAKDYFRQADAYIQAHEANAVAKTYTVQYRKVATDCLWRISERGDIFGNAYLWPKIWRSNRKTIQNPDLIYPGQVLIIPPK